MEYYALSVAAFVGIYVILATSYDLLMGYAGMFSIAHGAFYGVGSYAVALVLLREHVAFVPALIFGFLFTTGVGYLVGWQATRLAGDYLIVASLVFAFIVNALMLNLTDVTRGTMGLPGIPPPEIFGNVLSDPISQVVVIWVTAAICGSVVWRIVHSPYGRVLRSIRDDPAAASASGKYVLQYKRAIFALSAGLAGVAGGLYATYVQFIDPNSFVLDTSFLILIAVILGGRGTFWGPVVGATFVWVLPQAMTFLPLQPDSIGPVEQIAYGVIILLILRFRPQGLVGTLRRSRTQLMVSRPEASGPHA
jgi:branched-chain amino acid transport system permease protein